MIRKILLIGAGILAVIAVAGVIVVPRWAKSQAEHQIEAMARAWGLTVVDMDVSIGWKDITVRDLHLVAPGFSAKVREVRLPGWKITRWLTPSIRVGEIAVEGVTVDGEVPAAWHHRRAEAAGVGGRRLAWERLSVRGIALNVEDRNLRVVTQDGSWKYARATGGQLELAQVQLKSPWLPVYFIDAASVVTTAAHQIDSVKLSGLVWPFSKDFELYTASAMVKPEGDGRLSFTVEGRFLPDRGTLAASGVYDRKTGRLVSHAELAEAWVGLLIPPSLPVQNREAVRFSGRVDLTREAGISDVAANGRLSGVTVFHEKIAAEALRELSATFSLSARHDGPAGLLDVPELTFSHGKLSARASARLKKDPGSGKYLVTADLEVPQMSCADAVAAFPPALVPNLRQLTLGGTVDGRLHVAVDFARLDTEDAKLTGKINLDRCRVLQAPPALRATRLMADFGFSVVEPGGQRVAIEVAADNEWTRPLEEIATYMVSAVLTTEDGAFWRHHGLITSEFATALTQNLRARKFKYGASSITMQIVKNVFFERKKTLSRKLEELFFTWYVEQVVPKTRLMEIYLNIIELGPDIYGVPRAAQHFFNKNPLDLTAREAIYLASILPSPKKRYAFYCAGAVPDYWNRALDRLLAIMKKRGRLTQEEYDAALAETITFDPVEYPGKDECYRMIRRYQGK